MEIEDLDFLPIRRDNAIIVNLDERNLNRRRRVDPRLEFMIDEGDREAYEVQRIDPRGNPI